MLQQQISQRIKASAAMRDEEEEEEDEEIRTVASNGLSMFVKTGSGRHDPSVDVSHKSSCSQPGLGEVQPQVEKVGEANRWKAWLYPAPPWVQGATQTRTYRCGCGCW